MPAIHHTPTTTAKGADGFDRRAEREQMKGIREVRRMPSQGFQLREAPNGTGGTHLICEGYASVTCASEDDFSHAYEMEDFIGPYVESVIRGAFAKTLAENADVAFLINHSGVTMARTKPGSLRLAEDLKGLHYEARLNPKRPDVELLKLAIEDGAVDESSFAFRVVRQKWSYKEDNGEVDRRLLQELNLDKGDVSPVNFGASSHTADHPLAIRARLLDRNSGRHAGRGGAASLSVALATLPNYSERARAQLAALRRQGRGLRP